MTPVRWGIVGPGGIARNFADGLAQTGTGRLVALASRNGARRRAFGDLYAIAPEKRHPAYELLAADPDVDAVYIATPHPFHAEHALVALAAGKPVLCEKPGGMNAAEVAAVTETAARLGLFYMEAFMYRCHPQIARLLEILRSGEIGEVRHVAAGFGFPAHFDPRHRLFDPALGGGGILDVGGYPVSFARLVAGCAVGLPFDDPVALTGVGVIGRSGVDESARARLTFAGGVTADIACAIARRIDGSVRVTGSRGTITLPDPWTPGRDAGPSDATMVIAAGGAPRIETLHQPEQLFAFEADVASRAIAAGRLAAPAPALSPADSLGNALTLDRWRRAIGLVTIADRPTTAHRLRGTLPTGLPPIPTLVRGDATLPRLLLATGGRLPQMWDSWAEAGGTGFDPGRQAGLPHRERALGGWLAARGLGAGATVVVRPTAPDIRPETLEAVVAAALERLRITAAPILVLPDLNGPPDAEMLDAATRLRAAGLVRLLGAAWSGDRLSAADAWTEAAGLAPLALAEATGAAGPAPASDRILLTTAPVGAPVVAARRGSVVTVGPRTPADIAALLDGRPRGIPGRVPAASPAARSIA